MTEISTSEQSKRVLQDKVPGGEIADFLSVCLLCLSMVKTGLNDFPISMKMTILSIIGIQIILKHRISRKILIQEMLPFLVIIILELPLQILFNDGYYGWSSALSAVIVFTMTAITIFFMLNRGNQQIIWNVVCAVALVSSGLIILQTIAYYAAGIRLDQRTALLNQFFHGWKFQFFRPCGPFSEPSHFAELGLLALYYYLFISFHKTKASIIALGLILSTSSLGILGCVLLGVLYFLSLNRMNNLGRRKKAMIVIFTLIACIGLVFFLEGSTNPVIQRILSGGSASVRVKRSLELFQIMSPEHKLVGIGIQNQEYYLNAHGIILPSDNYETIATNREFAQTFGYILCTTGLLGACAFWAPLIRTTLKKDYRLKSYFILFFFLCATCCVFSRATFIMYLLIFFVLRNMNK